jgi:hypothetical protein
MDCGSGVSQPRDGLHDREAGAESQTLNLGLVFGLELGDSVEIGWQPIDVVKHAHHQASVAMSDIRCDHYAQHSP